MKRFPKVGELRPSQLLYSFGVGSIIELPFITVMVMGLDDWPIESSKSIVEPRLLSLVQKYLGRQVQALYTPPLPSASSLDFLDPEYYTGVPVRLFPKWYVCSHCHRLAHLSSGLFELKEDFVRPLENKYFHKNCNKRGKPPVALPVKYVLACEYGHLSDFPWHEYVHKNREKCQQVSLRLFESGITGEVTDVVVKCDICEEKRSMADAFYNREELPLCSGHHPHLHEEEGECSCHSKSKNLRVILTGASNIWFPCPLSTISLPMAKSSLERLVESQWDKLSRLKSKEGLEGLIDAGALPEEFRTYDLDTLWETIQRLKKAQESSLEEEIPLKQPEWEIFSNDKEYHEEDFQKTIPPVSVHPFLKDYFEKIVRIERLREVQALIGFTRISSAFEFGEIDPYFKNRLSPLARENPRWLPATENRGEGIFLELKEEYLTKWLSKPEVQERAEKLFRLHVHYRKKHGFPYPEEGFPGMRYILLHTLSHVIMRQLSLECGYSAASIRERIYAQEATSSHPPMAGILLYTAAPDAEGTLGGLVQQGEKDVFLRHLLQALERIRFCSSDPLCAESISTSDPLSIRGAACHACLYMPETSCERSNKYLDRSALVETLDPQSEQIAFFQKLMQ